MLSIAPFSWRRLTANSAIEHCVDLAGRLLLRSISSPDRPPLTTALVQMSGGYLARVPIAELGFDWTRMQNGDAWMLRTVGPPTPMANVVSRWGELAMMASEALGVDERLLLVTIACEAGDAKPNSKDDAVKATRTDAGYPARAGDLDTGDFARDLEDWSQSGGAHAAHGLMLTSIATAHAARPDLFEKVEPSLYRTVLWNPVQAIACGAAHIASFPAVVRGDPLAMRVQYRMGSLTPTPKSRWGVELPDELAVLSFVACWNDDACLRAGEQLPVLVPPSAPENGLNPLLLLGAAGLGAACIWAGITVATFKAKTDKDELEEEDLDDDDEDDDDLDDEDAA